MRISLTAMATATAGILLLTGTAAAAPGTATPHKGCSQTIHLTTTNGEITQVDNGTPGAGIGDLTVITGDLLENGEPAGTLGMTFTKIQQDPNDKTTVGGGIFKLEGRGQIAFSSMQTFPNDQPPVGIKNAITGGTDEFRNARGEVHVVNGAPTGGIYTLNITC
ncbi:hypothetical protein [Streptomyces sp. NBC_01264]|uniref:hypothetical protein n=1 Tax=Streptomyces sp. NBC_01264 TaxID=2903804 RepID=UPI002251AFC0|nr:hypothetical protein [Streptomyces sp. NBC_01264]MCX4783835.1 hypothetical protein [Streptomyces sp. NBC_01264]